MTKYLGLEKYRDVNINIGYKWQAGQPTTDDPRTQRPWKIPQTFALTAAVTGVFNMKEHNPAQPYTPPEIAAAGIEAAKAGASAVHFHVRDPQGKPAGKIEYWREVVGLIRESCGRDIVISGSTVRGDTFEEKVAPVMEGLFESCPVNIDPRYSPDFLKAQVEVLGEHGCRAELAIFDSGGIEQCRQLFIDSGLLKPPFCWILVPGMPRPGSLPMPGPFAAVEGLMFQVRLIREITPDAVITVAAAGRACHYLVTVALALGLNVRVGMEDTIWLYPHRDERLPNNRVAVENVLQVAQTLGRRAMNADEFRTACGIEKR